MDVPHKDGGDVRAEAAPIADPGAAMSGRSVTWLGLMLVATWTVLYAGVDIPSQVANLYPLESPESPYFQPAHAWLLYAKLPLVILASLALLLSPGVLLVLAIGGVKSWTELIILAFGTSFVIHVILTSAFKLIFGVALDSRTFFMAEVSAGALLWLVVLARVCGGDKLSWPLGNKTERRRLLWTLAISLSGLLALLPVIFWQDLSADGFGALDSGRSLFARFHPRWPDDGPDGLLGLGIGMIPMAYPIHWFIMLFGLIEAAARLPLLLYLPVIFCLLIQLIEFRSPRELGVAEEAVLFLALAVYTVTMSYSASYDPYFADIASPAAFESLTILCMLAVIYSLWSRRDFWFFFFAIMAYLCRPTGLMILGLLGLSVALCAKEQRYGWLVRISCALAVCIVFGFLYERVYIPLVVGEVGLGYSSKSIVERFRYLRWDDFSRINYALFPGGILPFVFLLAFRWQDSFGRLIALVSLIYFGVFYFPAFTALHHFVPVIIFPLVVFWRLYLFQKDRWRRLMLPAAAVAAALSLWLSLPGHFELNRTHRAIGVATVYRISDYTVDFRLLNHANLLLKLIPPDWNVIDPSRELVVSPYTIIYYALKPKDPKTEVNYIIQLLEELPPFGFTKIADDKIAALYVKDLEQWQRDRVRILRTDYQSRIYATPRSTLFPHWGIREGQYSIDLGHQPFIWRLFS